MTTQCRILVVVCFTTASIGRDYSSAALINEVSAIRMVADSETISIPYVIMPAADGVSIILAEFTPIEGGYEASINLWRVDAAGRKVFDVRVERVPGTQKRPALPGLPPVAITLSNGDIDLLVDPEAKGQSIVRITDDGKPVFRIKPPVPSLSGGPMYNRIVLGGGNSILVTGNDHEKGIVLRIDTGGVITWRKEYEFDESNTVMDGLPLNDGTYVICGRSWKKNGFREWVARIASDGTVVSRAEVMLSGLSGAASRLATIKGRVALIYPTVDETQKAVIRVRIYDEDLKQINDYVTFDNPSPHFPFNVVSCAEGIALAAHDSTLKAWISVLDSEGRVLGRTQLSGQVSAVLPLASVGGKLVALTREKSEEADAEPHRRLRITTFALATTRPGS